MFETPALEAETTRSGLWLVLSKANYNMPMFLDSNNHRSNAKNSFQKLLQQSHTAAYIQSAVSLNFHMHSIDTSDIHF